MSHHPAKRKHSRMSQGSSSRDRLRLGNNKFINGR
jgi:hypothetical protein